MLRGRLADGTGSGSCQILGSGCWRFGFCTLGVTPPLHTRIRVTLKWIFHLHTWSSTKQTTRSPSAADVRQTEVNPWRTRMKRQDPMVHTGLVRDGNVHCCTSFGSRMYEPCARNKPTKNFHGAESFSEIQFVKKFSAVYGTRRLITVFTRAPPTRSLT
jgi:hypothetical protein